jgi:hypothetical protein
MFSILSPPINAQRQPEKQHGQTDRILVGRTSKVFSGEIGSPKNSLEPKIKIFKAAPYMGIMMMSI